VPVLTRDDKRVLFVHVPKTGGTTIERLFVRSGYEMHLRATRKTEPSLFPLLRCSFQHLHGEALGALLDVAAFDVVFLLVRDPLARFRSEYAMRNQKDPRTDAATVEQWGMRTLDAYATNPWIRDNHLRPQAEFLVEGAEVFRLEDGMSNVVARLNAEHALGLGTEIPHAMHSRRRSGISSSSVELSPRLEQRLREFYAADFEAFGY
jgi:hypothetical protein